MFNRVNILRPIKVVQHNVQTWKKDRKNELTLYNRNADVILLNSLSLVNDEKIKIYNFNVYYRNYLNERHA